VVVGELVVAGEVTDHLLQEETLALEIYHVPRVEVGVYGGAQHVVVVAESFLDVGHLVPAEQSVLRVEQEVIGNVLDVFEVNFDAGQGVVAHIVIAHTKYNRHQSVKFIVENIEHIIKRIPTIEACPHAIIIGVITPQKYGMWIKLNEI